MEIMEVVWVIVLFWPAFVATFLALYSAAVGSKRGSDAASILAWLSVAWVIAVLIVWRITGVTQ